MECMLGFRAGAAAGLACVLAYAVGCGSKFCLARGGAYDSAPFALNCGYSQSFYRNAAAVTGGYIGFRCCAR